MKRFLSLAVQEQRKLRIRTRAPCKDKLSTKAEQRQGQTIPGKNGALTYRMDLSPSPSDFLRACTVTVLLTQAWTPPRKV